MVKTLTLPLEGHRRESSVASTWFKCIKIDFNNSVSLHRKVFIDFDKLQTRNAGLNVRRQSLLPAGQTEDIGWYFRDDQLWREYGSQVRKIPTFKCKISENQFNLKCPFSSSSLRAPTPYPPQSAAEMSSVTSL